MAFTEFRGAPNWAHLGDSAMSPGHEPRATALAKILSGGEKLVLHTLLGVFPANAYVVAGSD